ncbi:MAG TPA: CRTAC1 family protein [Bryobacteraceae bacterium]|jgi:hypothetical protein|nr:CRTAC1 family protein [Bryobacteraceae bacterium]
MWRGVLLLLGWFAAAPFTPVNPEYRNMAHQAGLVQPFPNGGTISKKFIIETTGSGVAWIDYNNDGYPDAFVISGEGGISRLYRNNGNSTFTDVTREAGILRTGWGQGACVGDYDNDGYPDLFVTYWGQNTLYHNMRGKGFEDVTAKAGLQQDHRRYNTGCAFLDYDHDGRLDLFVSNYLKFDPETTPKPGANPYCWYRGMPVNCGPRGLPFEGNLLYHNQGGGTFSDVSVRSGIAAPKHSYCLGALTGDFDGDGWEDIFVACDQTPSLLYINRRNGTFSEEALLRGVALDENGNALSGMGATAADYDGDGTLDIFRSNFSDERETLYRNRGGGQFDETTSLAGLARNTRFVGWGCLFFDFDNDGWKDLFLANGHVFPEVDRLKLDIHYRDRAILYHNLANGRFSDISEESGPGVLEKHSARGAAVADMDNDGSQVILINNQNEAPTLLKNQRKPAGNWVLLSLEGTRANRSAIGASVKLTAGGRTQIDEVRSGGSYLSQNDLRLHFGLGNARRIDRLEIRWPGGDTETMTNLDVNRVVRIRQTMPKTVAADEQLHPTFEQSAR